LVVDSWNRDEHDLNLLNVTEYVTLDSEKETILNDLITFVTPRSLNSWKDPP